MTRSSQGTGTLRHYRLLSRRPRARHFIPAERPEAREHLPPPKSTAPACLYGTKRNAGRVRYLAEKAVVWGSSHEQHDIRADRAKPSQETPPVAGGARARLAGA